MTTRLAATAVLTLTVVLAAPGPAWANDLDIKNLPDVSDSELAASVSDIDLPVADIDLPRPVDLDTRTTDGGEQVVTLSSDILFAFDKATMPAAATAKIAELVKGVPQKAKVDVGGHTDSRGSAARNATLSQQRAQAVAAAIRAARPDLVLTVTGFGSAQPVEPNERSGKDNPDGRAKNRRVEIRHAG